jgi:hypothetical protein
LSESEPNPIAAGSHFPIYRPYVHLNFAMNKPAAFAEQSSHEAARALLKAHLLSS